MANVDIPAGGEIQFEQGGMHVMLIGFEQSLEDGERVSFTLRFEHVGDMLFEAEVRQ